MREFSFYDAFHKEQRRAFKPGEFLRMQVEHLLICRTKVKVSRKQPLNRRSFMQSHFGGIPYFEKNETWPLQRDTGEPMDFVCQFVDTGEFPFPEGIKIIQLYFSLHQLHREDMTNAWLIKTYQDAHIDKYVPVLKTKTFQKSTFNPVYLISDVSLPDYETAIKINPMLHHMCKRVNRKKPIKAYNDIVNYLHDDAGYGSSIGGYPDWLYHESDFDMDFYNEGYRLLAQIDNECEAGICWGDVGTAYLFYKPEKKEQFEFVLQAF